ncbi:hypothetical protein ACM01_15690 [Streptomyces viridochromogenes]|uniref:Uncharacterized protein n=1 Tax=Streptomyces viridochromogenes TaxID=1938 RepID=A0A0J7ZE10_STRVR|nr:hypothetical protein ACM01_15690 [Streptomyces viridochromogenes]
MGRFFDLMVAVSLRVTEDRNGEECLGPKLGRCLLIRVDHLPGRPWIARHVRAMPEAITDTVAVVLRGRLRIATTQGRRA